MPIPTIGLKPRRPGIMDAVRSKRSVIQDPRAGKAQPVKALSTKVPVDGGLDPTTTDSGLDDAYGQPGHPGDPEFQAGEDILAEGAALEAPATAGAGGEGGAGGWMSLLSGGGGGSRGLATGDPNVARTATYFDPNPSAAENIAIGNRGLGHINLASLFRGATPNADYNPTAPVNPNNLPYQPTTGITGGLKRLFMGNVANDLNASAMQQQAAEQQAHENLRFMTDEQIRKGVQTHAQTGDYDTSQIVPRATAELDATATQTGLPRPAVQRLKVRGLTAPLDATEAQTGLTKARTNESTQKLPLELKGLESGLAYDQARTAGALGAERRANELQPGVVRSQDATIAHILQQIDESKALTPARAAALTGPERRADELQPLAVLTSDANLNRIRGQNLTEDVMRDPNAQAARAHAALLNREVHAPRAMGNDAFVDERGVVHTKSDPMLEQAGIKPAQYRVSYAPPVDMGADSVGGVPVSQIAAPATSRGQALTPPAAAPVDWSKAGPPGVVPSATAGLSKMARLINLIQYGH